MQALFLKFIGNASPLEITLIVVLGFTFYTLLKNQMNGLGQRLDNKISSLETKTEKNQEETKSEIKSINARIDKLYDLILDLYKTLSKKDAA